MGTPSVVIGFGCCVGSWDKFRANVRPGDGQLLMVASGHQHIAVAYNGILNAYAQYDALHGDLAGVVLQHDDLEITDPAAGEKIGSLLDLYPRGVIGVAGATNIHGLDWWNAQPYGHQKIESGSLRFGALPPFPPVDRRPVHMLEGSLIILGIEAARGLRFDTRFAGFHGYDELTYRAWREGYDVMVADMDTFHHTVLGSTTEKMAPWYEANQLFKKKWSL